MEQDNKKMIAILKKWESNLEKYGKLDEWTKIRDYQCLSAGLKRTKNARNLLDYCLVQEPKTQLLLLYIKGTQEDIIGMPLAVAAVSTRKRERFGDFDYTYARKRMYDERLKCADRRALCSIDIDLEDKCTERLVRRIVDKRMGQAYHREKKSSRFSELGNEKRFNTRHATSFQLHNMGIIECNGDSHRDRYTHWKRVYDEAAQKMVLKPKAGYATKEEAQAAIQLYRALHPEDKSKMSIYKCAYCGKYHIGHDRVFRSILEN